MREPKMPKNISAPARGPREDHLSLFRPPPGSGGPKRGLKLATGAARDYIYREGNALHSNITKNKPVALAV